MRFKIEMPSETGAGIVGFTDTVEIIIGSGDPGGGNGEFAEFIRSCLASWYDSANVVIEEKQADKPGWNLEKLTEAGYVVGALVRQSGNKVEIEITSVHSNGGLGVISTGGIKYGWSASFCEVVGESLVAKMGRVKGENN